MKNVCANFVLKFKKKESIARNCVWIFRNQPKTVQTTEISHYLWRNMNSHMTRKLKDNQRYGSHRNHWDRKMCSWVVENSRSCWLSVYLFISDNLMVQRFPVVIQLISKLRPKVSKIWIVEWCTRIILQSTQYTYCCSRDLTRAGSLGLLFNSKDQICDQMDPSYIGTKCES